VILVVSIARGDGVTHDLAPEGEITGNCRDQRGATHKVPLAAITGD